MYLEKTDSIPFKRYTNNEESSNSNSFGSNVAIVGNRIDVQDEPNYDNANKTGRPDYMDALQIVSFSKGSSAKEIRQAFTYVIKYNLMKNILIALYLTDI